MARADGGGKSFQVATALPSRFRLARRGANPNAKQSRFIGLDYARLSLAK
jgi:hypothetical protein